MRFHKKEYDSFIRLIDSSNLDVKEFSFVKRRGHLHVLALQSSFVFHRKERTFLNTNKQWEKEATYQVVYADKTHHTEEWSQVEVYFKNWLDSLH